MEIINIDQSVFEDMETRFESFKERVAALCNTYQSKSLGDWLDNQDVCLLLNISARTLQSYRDMGKIGFSQINHKIYYRASDIEKLLQSNHNLKQK